MKKSTVLQQVLQEMPYLHPGEMPINKQLDGSYSLATIKRDFTVVGTINDTEVLIHDTHSFVIGIKHDELTPAGRYIPTFRLDFKPKLEINANIDLPRAKMLQVNSVATMRHERGKGIASTIYKALVDAGFVVVSDSTQFDPGAALWKKLATDSEYTVIVVDVDHGPFKDSAGKIIKYDGNNIPDQDIWTQGSNFDGTYRVFVLYKN